MEEEGSEGNLDRERIDFMEIDRCLVKIRNELAVITAELERLRGIIAADGAQLEFDIAGDQNANERNLSPMATDEEIDDLKKAIAENKNCLEPLNQFKPNL